MRASVKASFYADGVEPDRREDADRAHVEKLSDEPPAQRMPDVAHHLFGAGTPGFRHQTGRPLDVEGRVDGEEDRRHHHDQRLPRPPRVDVPTPAAIPAILWVPSST